MIFQNWSGLFILRGFPSLIALLMIGIIHRPQWSPHALATQSTGVDRINETSAIRPPTLSNPSSVPDIRPDINMYKREEDDHSTQIPGSTRIIQQEHSLAQHDDIPALELFQSMWQSALPPPLERPGANVPHFIGYVETTTDALRLITAARQGVIPRITRQFYDSERRAMIRNGAVFVFCVKESGIKRWKDGLSWSPSRIVGNFQVCIVIPSATMVTPDKAACGLDVPPGRKAEFKSGHCHTAPSWNADRHAAERSDKKSKCGFILLKHAPQ
jgi:hypothetical protein